MTPERQAQIEDAKRRREESQDQLNKLNREILEYEKNLKNANAGSSGKRWNQADLDELKQRQQKAVKDWNRDSEVEKRVKNLPN